jgi:hypothetical protein
MRVVRPGPAWPGLGGVGAGSVGPVAGGECGALSAEGGEVGLEGGVKGAGVFDAGGADEGR